MIDHGPEPAAWVVGSDATPGELLDALVSGSCPSMVVPRVLDLTERDPFASGGSFPGDLVRGLMTVPGGFWGRHPGLYLRYTTVLRASAAARRHLRPEERMVFWTPLEPRTRSPHPAPDHGGAPVTSVRDDAIGRTPPAVGGPSRHPSFPRPTASPDASSNARPKARPRAERHGDRA